jgi:hypothetical protein
VLQVARSRVRQVGVTAGMCVLAAGALAGCGSGKSEPSAAAFTASPVCRQAAVDLLAIAKTTRHSGSANDLSTALTSPQKRLLALPDATAVQPVTTAIGFLRIRAVADTYTDDLRIDVRTATQQMIDHCTGGSAA